MERYRGPEQPHSIAPRQCAVCPVQASTERTERDMQNESIPDARGPVFCGVDTHADSHWLYVLDWRGRKVLSASSPPTRRATRRSPGRSPRPGAGLHRDGGDVVLRGGPHQGTSRRWGCPCAEALSPARMQRRRPGQESATRRTRRGPPARGDVRLRARDPQSRTGGSTGCAACSRRAPGR